MAGRVALVTGSSRGIGRAVALRVVREGATAFVGSIGYVPFRGLLGAAKAALESLVRTPGPVDGGLTLVSGAMSL